MNVISRLLNNKGKAIMLLRTVEEKSDTREILSRVSRELRPILKFVLRTLLSTSDEELANLFELSPETVSKNRVVYLQALMFLAPTVTKNECKKFNIDIKRTSASPRNKNKLYKNGRSSPVRRN